MAKAYKDKLLGLCHEGSIIKRSDKRLCLLTGQSSFVTSRFDKDKKLFLDKLSYPGLEVTPVGFPWHSDFDNNSSKPGLLLACIRNTQQYLWLRYDLAYKKISADIIGQAIAMTAQKLIIITGSCGTEYLANALETESSLFKKVSVIALGPVGKNITSNKFENFCVIQGKYDSWSKLLWNGNIEYSPECGHMGYYKCPETLEIVKSFINKVLDNGK